MSLRQLVIFNFGEDYIEEPHSNEMRFKCKHCEELGKRTDDYKLYVNKVSGKFHCFRCGWSGKLDTEDVPKESNQSELVRLIESCGNKIMRGSVINDDAEDDITYYKLPSIVPSMDDVASRYLMSRGVSYDDILRYNMRVSSVNDHPKFYGRIVIPNRIVGKDFTDMYVARSYCGQVPKYKNPYNSPKNNILFNYHNIPKNAEQMIICEGVLTSIVAGPDSVATYGKSISDTQLKLIRDKHPKRIYVAWDYDTDEFDPLQIDKTQSKLDHFMMSLLQYNDWEVYLVKVPPNRDAVDIGRDVFRNKYLKESVVKFTSAADYNLYAQMMYLDKRR